MLTRMRCTHEDRKVSTHRVIFSILHSFFTHYFYVFRMNPADVDEATCIDLPQK